MTGSTPSRSGIVEAAGGVLWRHAGRGREVALVHRPKYDDWSLPKGKREPGEDLKGTAVREVEEETGHVPRLGRYLTQCSYAVTVAGLPVVKVVKYWAMADTGGRFDVSDEVDQIVWLSVEEAMQRSQFPTDRQVLTAFVEMEGWLVRRARRRWSVGRRGASGGVRVSADRQATEVEIEAKFDADESFELPSLLEVDPVAALEQPVEQQLEATYFDTTDLRLARAGITLRRRTGGLDDGWHLKLPLESKGERLEVRRPLGRAVRTVPKPLTALARAHARRQPLQAMATLATQRVVHRLLDASGEVLAAVADDHVTAAALPGAAGQSDGGSRERSSGSALASATSGTYPAAVESMWRELEVEQVSGEPELLAQVGALLLAAGATPATAASKLGRLLGDRAVVPVAGSVTATDASGSAGDVVRGYLAEQLTALLRWDPRARMDEPDAVHKMRVATRRLRSALATHRKLLDETATEPIRGELKWLGQVLGEPRDAEVMHARLRELVAGLPARLVLGPVRRRIDMTLRARHREAHARLVTELDSERYLKLLDSLDELVAATPLVGAADASAADVLPGLVARSRKRVLRFAAEARDAPDPETREHLLHDVRKAAKRARYAGESVAGVFGAKATKFAARMEHLQVVLGEHQDSIVTRALIRELGVEAHGRGENAFTFGILYGLEHAHGARAEAAYAGALTAVTRKRPKWLR